MRLNCRVYLFFPTCFRNAGLLLGKENVYICCVFVAALFVLLSGYLYIIEVGGDHVIVIQVLVNKNIELNVLSFFI